MPRECSSTYICDSHLKSLSENRQLGWPQAYNSESQNLQASSTQISSGQHQQMPQAHTSAHDQPQSSRPSDYQYVPRPGIHNLYCHVEGRNGSQLMGSIGEVPTAPGSDFYDVKGTNTLQIMGGIYGKNTAEYLKILSSLQKDMNSGSLP